MSDKQTTEQESSSSLFTKSDAIEQLHDGWSIIFAQGRLIAEMPIEEWLEAFDKAEALAPVTSPDLFREYIYDGKGAVIKDVLRGALAFKRAVQKARETVETMSRREPK